MNLYAPITRYNPTADCCGCPYMDAHELGDYWLIAEFKKKFKDYVLVPMNPTDQQINADRNLWFAAGNIYRNG